MNNLYKLFVYGTLKRGQPNHKFMVDKSLGQCTFIGEARTTETYPMVIATEWNLPFLLDVPGVGKIIYGEIYEVDDHFSKWLDDFESLYIKKAINVEIMKDAHLGSTRHLTCQAYMLTNFPQGLLNLPLYSSYDCYGPHNRIYITESDRSNSVGLMDAFSEELKTIDDRK